MGKPGSVTIAPQSRHLPGVMFMCAVLAPALTMIFFIVLRAGHDALWLDASLAYADLEFVYFVVLPMTILMAVPLGLIPAWLWLSMARRAALRLGGRRPAFIAACALSGLAHALFVWAVARGIVPLWEPLVQMLVWAGGAAYGILSEDAQREPSLYLSYFSAPALAGAVVGWLMWRWLLTTAGTES